MTVLPEFEFIRESTKNGFFSTIGSQYLFSLLSIQIFCTSPVTTKYGYNYLSDLYVRLCKFVCVCFERALGTIFAHLFIFCVNYVCVRGALGKHLRSTKKRILSLLRSDDDDVVLLSCFYYYVFDGLVVW